MGVQREILQRATGIIPDPSRPPRTRHNADEGKILQKITYPTGGSTEYIFEPHTYCASVQEQNSPQIGFSVVDNANDSIAGGLRIKTIIDRNGDKTETRNFFYTKNGRSSGILSGTPVFFIKRDYNGKVAIGGNGRGWIGPLFWKDKGTESTLELSYWIGSESYLNQLSTTDGNHVTYSNVTEVFSDGGRIEYEYSNHREALDASFEGDISCYSPENRLHPEKVICIPLFGQRAAAQQGLV